MPRSSGQSDFVLTAEVKSEIELPPSAKVVELPRAIWRSPFATARSTRIVLGATFVVLAVLAILCVVGPHIPSGG
jgi:hypothetical protein